MKFTNKENLPKGIYDAIVNDSYSKGDADYSASQLMMPPQMRRLLALKWNEVEVDISEEIWKLLGSSVHYILEKQQILPSKEKRIKEAREKLADWTAAYYDNQEADISKIEEVLKILREGEESDSFLKLEERIYGTLAGKRISGQPDWLDTFEKKIEDYKVTSVWKYLKEDYNDYKMQLNIYRWLYKEATGNDIDNLQVNLIMKDWKLGEMKRREDYPRTPVKKVMIEPMSLIDITKYLLERLELHEKANQYNTEEELAENLPCTPEERWHKPDTWKVVKGDSTRAVPGGVFSEEEYGNEAEGKAKTLLSEKGGEENGYKIRLEPGEDVRCQMCIVRNFCSQYNQRKVQIGEKGELDILEKSESKEGDIFSSIPDKEIDASKMGALGTKPTSEPNVSEPDIPEEKSTEKKNPDETFSERFSRQRKQNEEHLKKKKEDNKSSDNDTDSFLQDLGLK